GEYEALGNGRALVEGKRASVHEAVLHGLQRAQKSLPAWLLYDDEGSRLYQQITQLPEYYPWRAERQIFADHGRAIIAAAAREWRGPLRLAELGAGDAEKSELLLEALIERQGSASFMPIDVSSAALEVARARLARQQSRVSVRPFVGRHEQAFRAIRELGQRKLVLFIGSSIANYEDHEARKLLCGLRAHVDPGDALLLGTDLQQDPALLVPAYDDAQGVTAQFNKNLLTRINRELAGGFRLETFTHVALWNAELSRIEMHLESTCDQSVPIRGLELTVTFRRGERIHTESSIKYDLAHVDRLLAESGWTREQTFYDQKRYFGAHVARAGASHATECS
ncbi:MAG TPA: L-histidine N(alpha)-methyltransferase, partial [Polyangiaceae bacterium]